MKADSAQRVPAAAIASFIADSLGTLGFSAVDAAKVAELMTEADLTGVDAHGVFRLPSYVKRIKAGGTNPRPNIAVTRNAPATALVDGDNGMGHLVMARAAETAIEIARETGFAWVGARMSNHAGAAGVYAALPLPHGMVGIYSVMGEREPHGGLGRRGDAARHHAARHCDSGRRGSAGGARYCDLGRLLWHDQELPACRAAKCRKAGWSTAPTDDR